MKRLALKVKIALALAVIATFVTASALRARRQAGFHSAQSNWRRDSLAARFTHSTDDWEEDVLGKDTLASGDSVKITFDDRDKPRALDLKVTDKDGNALEWYDLISSRLTKSPFTGMRRKAKAGRISSSSPISLDCMAACDRSSWAVLRSAEIVVDNEKQVYPSINRADHTQAAPRLK